MENNAYLTDKARKKRVWEIPVGAVLLFVCAVGVTTTADFIAKGDMGPAYAGMVMCGII